MSIEESIVKLLSDDSDLNVKVGDRIFAIFVPEGAEIPALTYNEIDGVRDNVMSGASGLVQARFQINCWAKKYSEAREVADLVRDALSPKDDDYPKVVLGTTVQAVMLLSENDVPAIHSDNEEKSGFGKMLDFSVWFLE